MVGGVLGCLVFRRSLNSDSQKYNATQVYISRPSPNPDRLILDSFGVWLAFSLSAVFNVFTPTQPLKSCGSAQRRCHLNVRILQAWTLFRIDNLYGREEVNLADQANE
jgi:hypothetical protein